MTEQAYYEHLEGDYHQENKYPLHDARGIYVASVCDQCESHIKAKYRSDIFTDSQYPADEPIEPEEY